MIRCEIIESREEFLNENESAVNLINYFRTFLQIDAINCSEIIKVTPSSIQFKTTEFDE